jgi:hypothetical protein
MQLTDRWIHVLTHKLTYRWDREAWIRGFETARTEECYELEGSSIPKDLDGTLFRNGHAKFDVNVRSLCDVRGDRSIGDSDAQLDLIHQPTNQPTNQTKPNQTKPNQTKQGVKIAHPFDGDGMISAITFKDGRAFFRNRFVRTKGACVGSFVDLSDRVQTGRVPVECHLHVACPTTCNRLRQRAARQEDSVSWHVWDAEGGGLARQHLRPPPQERGACRL